MRLQFVLLLSILSTQTLYAENSMRANSSLDELNGKEFSNDQQVSDWGRLLQEATSQPLKKAHLDFEYGCSFPDAPEYGAPGWVCDEPIEGFDITAVGGGYGDAYKDEIEKVSDKRGDYINRVDAPIKAYLDALVLLQSQINIYVENKVREYSNEHDEKIKEGGVSKRITSIASLSEKTRLKHMIKNYSEFDANGKKTASISTAVLKLSHSSDHCKTLIKTYVETTLEDDVDVAETKVSRGQCGFHQIVEDMAESGWKLLNMIKSPGGAYYTLVGHIEPVDELADAAIKTSMENDRKLWEQFKAQRGDELEMEIKKEFGSE